MYFNMTINSTTLPILQHSILSDHDTLTIPLLVLHPYLGVPDAERSRPQPVHVTISLEFLKEVAGCQSDNIDDTFCYHTLRDTLVDKLRQHQFHLIEHLTQVIGEVVLEQARNKDLGKVRCRVLIHKVTLPLTEMTHGAFFSKVFLS
jgi:FolB domain-containing protein